MISTPKRHHAFTLIELLLVTSIIAALAGILLASLGVIREKSRSTQATSLLDLLGGAMESYRSEDAQHHYPPVHTTDLCLSDAGHAGSTGVLGIMDQRGYFAPGNGPWDGERRLLDPWGSTYRYSLERPSVSLPTNAFHDWNWEESAGHERRWGMRRDPVSGVVGAGPLIFPYLWSLGRARSISDGTTWVHPID